MQKNGKHRYKGRIPQILFHCESNILLSFMERLSVVVLRRKYNGKIKAHKKCGYGHNILNKKWTEVLNFKPDKCITQVLSLNYCPVQLQIHHDNNNGKTCEVNFLIGTSLIFFSSSSEAHEVILHFYKSRETRSFLAIRLL